MTAEQAAQLGSAVAPRRHYRRGCPMNAPDERTEPDHLDRAADCEGQVVAHVTNTSGPDTATSPPALIAPGGDPCYPGGKILIRADAAGCTHELLDWLVGQRLSYSVGFTLPDTIADELAAIPERDWQIAYDAEGEPRPGAWVVIVRRERPHPGAQLRITDPDGHRYTAFATNTPPGGPGRQLADLELRHRRRARAEDRIVRHEVARVE